MATGLKTPSRRRESIYLALTLLPIALVLIALLGGFAREAMSSAQVETAIKNLKVAGEPTDYASLVDYRLASLPKTVLPGPVLAAQTKLNNAAQHIASRYSVVPIRFPESRKLIPPNQTVSCEKILARYAEDAMPIIEATSKQGIGSSTLHVLEESFRRAYHSGDTKLAIETLSRVFDNDLVLSSLEFDVWTADDLSQLRELADVPLDRDKQWQKNVSASRGEFLSFVERVDANISHDWWDRDPFDHPLGIAPSHIAARLTLFQRAEQLRGLGTKEARDAAEKIKQDESAFSVVTVPFALSNMSAGFNRDSITQSANDSWLRAMNKRRVITAIAIKQFKLQEGHWPVSLDDLAKVGLTSADWKIVGNQDFGYRVIEDGNAALLWTGGVEYIESPQWHEKSFRTPAQPPSEVYLNLGAIAKLESRIR